MTDQLQIPSVPLVDGAWLQAHLDHAHVRILDTRGRIPRPGTPTASLRAEYDAAHIPGAAFVTWDRDFIDLDDPVKNQLARPEQFATAAGAFGIGPDTLVVAYDDYHSIFAARLWWAFRAMGHDRVRVLDGGWTDWLARGRPTSTTSPAIEPTTFTPNPRPGLRWTIDDIAARPDDVVLVDARSRERFAGRGNDPVPGRIPGAVNAPYVELVGDDGLLRPREELARVLRDAGIDPDDPPRQLVGTCGSGISAPVPLLALEVLAPGAGVRGAVYDGSWSEWSSSGQPVVSDST